LKRPRGLLKRPPFDIHGARHSLKLRQPTSMIQSRSPQVKGLVHTIVRSTTLVVVLVVEY